MIDRRPALIARCAGTSDVIAAIGFARSEGLVVAVRGGGHNVAGNATCDGGLVIDLSPMKGVRVDPEARTVRAQGGVTWGELDRETQAFGLATTGGLVSSTGIAGFTLGGGIGWLMRKHGLACDNLISAELVTADGQTVRASETENAELLWGLRGGGGNFGVVTEFEFRLHRVSQVLGGLLAWPAQAGGEVLRFWRDWVRDTPDELCTMAAFLYAPPEPFVPPEMRGAPIFAIACFHTDLEGSAGDDLQALRDQKPALDVLGPMPYTAIQGMFDAGVPRGSRNYWRSGYVDVLTDEAIGRDRRPCRRSPGTFGSAPPPSAWRGAQPCARRSDRVRQPKSSLPRELRGTVARPGSGWSEHGMGARGVRRHRALRHGHAVCQLPCRRGRRRRPLSLRAGDLARAFGTLKARYDPTNFFHLNQNIKPA